MTGSRTGCLDSLMIVDVGGLDSIANTENTMFFIDNICNRGGCTGVRSGRSLLFDTTRRRRTKWLEVLPAVLLKVDGIVMC